ncbi:MAG: CbiX/SirB N-terminal domain-containing protein [Terrimicrobiaceae bacterium]|nr:CbiX/SirB N-terminal domain-containing protein [Terrimicrobiaceae bacterium]
MNDLSTTALVLVGHGSTLNPDSSAPTLLHAAEIRRRGIFAEVVTAFWKEEPSFREVLRMIDSEDVFVVPNFISEGYFTRTVIPRELRLEGTVTVVDGKTVRYCEPTGNHPAVTGLLIHRAREVAPDVPTAETSLLIVGHGTGLNDNSAVAAKHQVRVIAETGTYAEVLAAYMEEPPLIAEWDQFTTQPNVVVVPFFISDGLHSYQDIPVLLGINDEPGAAASEAEVFRHNPHDLRGRRLYYASAIGTDPGFADIILDQVRAFTATPVTA